MRANSGSRILRSSVSFLPVSLPPVYRPRRRPHSFHAQPNAPKTRRAMLTIPSSGAHPPTIPDLSPSNPMSNISTSMPATYTPRYIDVGVNLTDPVFTGVYHDKKVHDSDLENVIARSKASGCTHLMATGSNLRDSRLAIKLASAHAGYVFATVGVHPCSAKQFESTAVKHAPINAEEYLDALRNLAIAGRDAGIVVAFGEFGLDYDRLGLCPVDTQRRWFARQLDVAEEVGLPLFLHSRAAARDFGDLLFPRLPNLKGGLVHSFTGTVDEMREIVGHGLYVGINGCSLKTDESLAVVKEVPLDRLMLETDGPWCEIRPSHSSAKLLREAGCAIRVMESKKKERFKQGVMVKGRNEPAAIGLVAHAVALVKGVEVEEVCEAAWRNTVDLFGFRGPTDNKLVKQDGH